MDDFNETRNKIVISIKNVSKKFGEAYALRDVSLEIQTGEKIVIIGPSGSGKSTLIRCINGLEKPTTGTIVVDGIDVTAKKVDAKKLYADVAMVFQDFNLYPHKTVLENVTIAPIKVLHVPKDEAERSGAQYLERVGLCDKVSEYPSNLSGGQKQRVAIARALNMHPQVMLFDEPTSALDPEMIQEVFEVINDLARGNITMVIVTHEMGFARETADRVVFMEVGQIVDTGTPRELFEEGKNPRIQAFLNKKM